MGLVGESYPEQLIGGGVLMIGERLMIEGDGGRRFGGVEEHDRGGVADPFDGEGELVAGLVSGEGFAGGSEHVGRLAAG